MNKWRRMWDAFRQDGSPEDLVDINEQELAKDTSVGGVVSEHRENGEIRDKVKSDVKNINDTGGINEKSQTGITLSDVKLVKADENKSVTAKETEKKEKQDAKRDEVKDFGNFEDEVVEKGRSGSAFLKTVIAISMLASMLIFIFVLLGAFSEEDEGEMPQTDAETSGESSEPVREGDRVIYIRDLTEDSGIMSTAEIYAENSASVVTVVASSESGTSIGTGFILSSDGYIATAQHTLEGAQSIRILLEDGRKLEAQIVGEDAFSDLALLRVYADRLVPVTLGDSDKLLVGEPVVAIGTPYSEEFAGSAFSGSVSSTNRVVSVYDDATGKLEKKMNFVQLSATLGKGCSGCPIFDEYGKVIGILSARLGDGTNGVCFAIPINGAASILESLKSDGNADGAQNAVATPAPKLGVIGTAVNEGGVKGVKIGEFSSDTCDAALKLRIGDIIVSVGERETPTYLDVSGAISNKVVGERVLVTVYRAGQYLSFDVELTK